MRKLLLLPLFLFFIHSVHSQDLDRVKSNVIIYISKNVEWPNSKRSDRLIITVVGESKVFDHLSQASGNMKLGNSVLVVVKVEKLEQIKDTHIIYLPAENSKLLFKAVQQAEEQNALLIADGSELANKGAAISFIQEGDRLAYEVNHTSIDRANLKVSSKLLSMSGG